MAAMVMESPGVHYPESLADQDDVVYPCKGCGEILEEGKAFELAGNRWHIDCFRCNTCGTLLDSDANLLLLGDGSLICNNCTYSCNACGNKIEDLAILTGDQAFCASCFRCRNCKRKIENLRYARTSQGIFCMSCHESLMARRRKKAKAAPRQQSASNGPSEKALPSLPPGAAPPSAFSPEMETPPSDQYSEGPNTRSPRQQQLRPSREIASSSSKRDVSPLSDEARRDGPTLPASTYSESRPSNISEDTDDGEERGFLPMAFDPTLAPGPPPTTSSIARKQVPQNTDRPSPPVLTENRLTRDYFTGRQSGKSASRDAREDARSRSPARSVSTEREPDRKVADAKQSPHIFFQEKGRSTKRQASGTNTPASTAASPAVAAGADGRVERPKPQHLDTGSFTLGHGEGFKLQEVPKNRKGSDRSVSKGEDGRSPVGISPVDAQVADARQPTASRSPISLDSPGSGVNPFDDPKRKDAAGSSAPPPPKHADRPARGDSLAASTLKSKTSTPEPRTPTNLTPTIASTQLAPGPAPDRRESTSSVPYSFVDAQSTISSDGNINNIGSRIKSGESPSFRSSFDVAPPPRASSRPSAPSAPSKSVANGDFIMPRHAPPPPPTERHRNNASISTMQSVDTRSEGQLSPAMRSPGLPKASRESGFSMEEEMARILRGDKRDTREDSNAPPSVLRRVSNAVKHGRSFSDRGVNASVTSQSPPSSTGPIQISSPMALGSPNISSPTASEPLEQLRKQNRRQGQRIAELEAERATLEERLNNSAEIKAATSELREKRNTMVVLDTQREMVVAELESMTAHLQRAKESNQPLDLNSLKSDIMRDFADSLQKLKEQMSGQIEDLMHKRTELTDEIGTLIQMKDKGFQEYESLSSRNAQLLEMNGQLVQNIQETYKANKVPNGAGSTNGLGIYNPGAKMDTSGSMDLRTMNLISTDSSMPNFLQETEAEPATVLTAPQVVNIRKGGQAKKFNWRKGGEKMAKNVTKGIKGAFVGESSASGVRGKEIGAPYGAEIGGVPYGQHMQGSAAASQATGGSEQNSLKGQTVGPNGAAGFGFFSQKNGGLKTGPGGLAGMKNNSSTNLATPAADPSVLFGSELEARCEFEKRVIPAVVSHCIEEVEARGMEIEGIYRKSGGSGQVKIVQQGFEKDSSYDISDPDLDIHAVTSALKQYFRRLPTPLITYDVYESLLEAGQSGDGDREKQALHLRAAVGELPEHHRNCLEYLIQHLARVMSYGEENLMTPLNLAVVFAPTIMRPFSIEREMSDMQAQRIAVQALIELHESVFDE
ncbi:Rho-type gtpase-activating protein [Recurvomyces mirabilis]|uniref:Rho-type gtpase-activating protein n=1 Tax=Recurvomyces mirabilis TaxID=574656 RepID=A0AAE0WIP6_9PEZI|nr:Rho-type gtpase-activating protein [Recurvomyces mirabilis]KAK5156187.1 Rho-type gtpase-activating protein [Recurvomyces mirabilis]